jgi:transposase-like protein
MSRPPAFAAADKIRIVLSVLTGEMTVAEAARRNKLSETSMGKWRQQFLEAESRAWPRAAQPAHRAGSRRWRPRSPS